MIKKVKIFTNNNSASLEIANLLREELVKRDYIISEDDFDLAIAVGGDGSFLRMVKECNFSDKVFYLGVNTGTLGFAQELYPSDIDDFLDKLGQNEYKVESIGTEETRIYTRGDVINFYSLSEIVLRDAELNTLYLDIMVNDNLLETFVGDGILISTSFGSSAYNLSFGGSLVYSELHTLQITPIAPLNNRSYRSLQNSVIIPENRIITSLPVRRSKNLIVTVDGVNNTYYDVDRVETYTSKNKIKCLRLHNYDYTKKINEKFTKE